MGSLCTAMSSTSFSTTFIFAMTTSSSSLNVSASFVYRSSSSSVSQLHGVYSSTSTFFAGS